ncbi:MAG: hypothetical protein HOP02_02075 [Methylococcaceae bacterium]|nr:hypothetical protein [Methylococcaceae bacterium]
MNIPGFTAEVALYSSVTLYRSSRFIYKETGLNVTPQLRIASGESCRCYGDVCYCDMDDGGFYGGGGAGRDLGEVRCRVNCNTRFRTNPARLKACLAGC